MVTIKKKTQKIPYFNSPCLLLLSMLLKCPGATHTSGFCAPIFCCNICCWVLTHSVRELPRVCTPSVVGLAHCLATNLPLMDVHKFWCGAYLSNCYAYTVLLTAQFLAVVLIISFQLQCLCKAVWATATDFLEYRNSREQSCWDYAQHMWDTGDLIFDQIYRLQAGAIVNP